MVGRGVGVVGVVGVVVRVDVDAAVGSVAAVVVVDVVHFYIFLRHLSKPRNIIYINIVSCIGYI